MRRGSTKKEQERLGASLRVVAEAAMLRQSSQTGPAVSKCGWLRESKGALAMRKPSF